MIVSETFYSIQGEGITTGVPSVFLRLAGCNLLCESSEWRCDTIEVWQKGIKTRLKDVLSKEMIEHLTQGAHLVITGGEPLLHQKDIADLLLYLNEINVIPYTEIETNGTKTPDEILSQRINQWNVSPKLANSGERFEKRVNSEAILKLLHLDSVFKFVISKEEDWDEITHTYPITSDRIILMPAGENQEQLSQTRVVTAELCKKHHVRFSDRTHISIWNKKTGV